ncbi:MAG TPA: ABC transporter permease, partial [Vicinamibacteria bacterium]|nr:ABC transporter permease [Vicinamibacteria bacterium]
MRLAKAELALVWRLFRADLAHQRKRILLTVIAIGWGTLSIVLLLSFGEGLRHSFSKGSRGMGEGIAVVWPGSTTKAFMGLPSGRFIRPREEDVELLRRTIPELAAISLEYNRETPMAVNGKTRNVHLCGVQPEWGEMRNMAPRPGGRFIDDPDFAEKRRVVFLGDELARDLYGTEEVVGRTLQINQSTFTVIGVLQKKIQMGMYGGPDKNHAHIPGSTYKAMFTDAKIDNVIFKARSPQVHDVAKTEFYRVMGRKYHFDPEDTRALGMWDTYTGQKITDNIGLGIQIFLGIIGALTLLVGGMGVANIMYAVVKERTREIGVKMALGAKPRQLMLPFVGEALLMTVIGGVAGTTISLL